MTYLLKLFEMHFVIIKLFKSEQYIYYAALLGRVITRNNVGNPHSSLKETLKHYVMWSFII